MGAYGVAWKLNDLVVVKVPRRRRRGAPEEFAAEQRAYNALRALRSPYLLPCLHINLTRAIFLLCGACDLKAVITAPAYAYDPATAFRWMGQVCGGAAFLERQALAHGDLRPDNILVDQGANLRLHDLGSALAVGAFLPVGTEPFARLLSKADGTGAGTYGKAGAASENFAIGSILYTVTRGHYPYASEKYDVKTLMDMFQRKDFPVLTDSFEDAVVSNCWWARYESVAALEQVFRDLGDGSEWYVFQGIEQEEGWLEQMEKDCKTWVDSSGLGTLPDI